MLEIAISVILNASAISVKISFTHSYIPMNIKQTKYLTKLIKNGAKDSKLYPNISISEIRIY